ncbi:MAG: HlyD family efflux transporter periplasmic adaptor subunit [Bryobacteraceae bacterium]|nr:HlyD family efflux transporter periplasmic adaptor subunit [Bryobacteraceae bacterium]
MFLFIVIAAGLVMYFARQRGEQPARVQRQVRTAVVRRGAIERTARVSGIVSSPRLTHLMAPRLRGTRSRGSEELRLEIEKLASGGARLRKGEVVAEFDRQFMLLRVDDYRASLAQREETLVRLRANLELRREQQRQRIRVVKAEMEKFALDLKTAPVRSAMQVERFRMNFEEAQARYEQTLKEVPLADASEVALVRVYEIEVEQARVELAKAERNLADLRVLAPVDGLMLLSREYRGGDYREYEQGDTVGPGRSFAAVVPNGRMIVDAAMNQVDIGMVQVGQKARVRFDGIPDTELPAHVSAVAALPSRGGYRAQYVRNVPLRLEIDERDDQVTPNLSASADIVLERVEGALVVPRDCIFSGGEGPVAYVQDGDGWKKRELQLGLANHVEVAVKAGLEEGDQVSAEFPY